VQDKEAFMTKSTIPLNLIYDYPVRWSRFKTLRDFVQNFYDAVGWQNWSTRFSFDIVDSTLTLRATDVGFSYDWLLHIGASTKREGQHAGYFGEGFKIASLCAIRDHGWNVSLSSRNWSLDVCSTPINVDSRTLLSLAYEIETDCEEKRETVMRLCPFEDRTLMEAVTLSFFHPENPLFDRCLWQSSEGAVYTRSKRSKPAGFPSTYNDSGPGIVFAGFQAMGSFQEPLVFCLHNHRNDDRDRGTYYSMQVVDLIQRLVPKLSSESSSDILKLLKRRWYERPGKKYDFTCYFGIIRKLLENISQSTDALRQWQAEYPNLLVARCVRRNDLKNINRRSQSLCWMRHSENSFRLVQEGFSLLGYPTLEDVCARHGGFTVVHDPNEMEILQIRKLETIVAKIIPNLPFELPPCKMIISETATWRGMAICVRLAKSSMSYRNILIRFHLPYIAIKRSLLMSVEPNVALGTYLHELAHVFGGDSSANFSRGLSEFLDAVLTSAGEIQKWKAVWSETA